MYLLNQVHWDERRYQDKRWLISALRHVTKIVMPVEKRRQKRFINRFEAEFKNGNIAGRGFASDFSLDGLFIKTNSPFASGTILDIIIYLSKDSTSRIRGNVARASKTFTGKVLGIPIKQLKNGMGIEIIKKDVNYLHLIRYLLYQTAGRDKRLY